MPNIFFSAVECEFLTVSTDTLPFILGVFALGKHWKQIFIEEHFWIVFKIYLIYPKTDRKVHFAGMSCPFECEQQILNSKPIWLLKEKNINFWECHEHQFLHNFTKNCTRKKYKQYKKKINANPIKLFHLRKIPKNVTTQWERSMRMCNEFATSIAAQCWKQIYYPSGYETIWNSTSTFLG